MKPPNLNYQLLMQSPLEKDSLCKNDYFIDEEDESFLWSDPLYIFRPSVQSEIINMIISLSTIWDIMNFWGL